MTALGPAPETAPDTSPVLRVTGLAKRYGDVIANAGVDFELRRGEIHALVGENGAGKTTLMQILYGMVAPDSGTVEIDGEPMRFRSPAEAIARGVGMVHQHFMLVPDFTVVQNVTLGAEPTRGGFVDNEASLAALRTPMAMLGLDVDPHAVVGTLSVAQRQRIEMLKVLHRGARIMILDEPTAVLTPQETAEMFTSLRRLAGSGISVIFISHKLGEVLEIADRVTVLRQGRTRGTHDAVATDIPTLVAAMTGRAGVGLGRLDRPAPSEKVVLDVSGLSGRAGSDAAVTGLAFRVHAGEVVGIAGVDGNGQVSLVALLTGTVPASAGRVLLDGRDVTTARIAERRGRGLAYVPADRHADGLPLHGTVLEALAVGRLVGRRGLDGWRPALSGPLRSWAKRVLHRFEVKAAGPGAVCVTLSGGNQQKVVLARELESGPRLVVMAQPTRGVDLGAADGVYAALADVAAAGAAAVVVSADLDELMRISDRILVLYRGDVVADVEAQATTREQLGMAMVGGAAVAGGRSTVGEGARAS